MNGRVAGKQPGNSAGAGKLYLKKFEIIDHTADTGIVARGETLARAFENAALGMFSIITEISRINKSDSRTVEVHAADIESLLVEWLNELVYIFDVDHLIFSRFDVHDLSDSMLKATCYGEKYDPLKHILKTGIKSATFYMLSVNRQENCVKVIFDV